MSGLQQRAFGYAHIHAILAGLEVCAVRNKEYIGTGHGFVDKPGSYEEFQDMLEIAHGIHYSRRRAAGWQRVSAVRLCLEAAGFVCIRPLAKLSRAVKITDTSD